MAKFIVFAGKKQAGKTTAAKFATHGRDLAKVVSFADPIKEFCLNVLGLTHGQVYGTDEEKNELTDIMWDNMPEEIRWRYAIRPDVDESYDHIETRVLDNTKMRSGPMTARNVMQVFGTDMIRTYFDRAVWAKALFRKHSNTLHRFIIVDDCRFPNEADIALENGAILIRLTRDIYGDDAHASETALDNYPVEKYSYVVDNQDLTVEETQKILEKILHEATL